MLNTRSLSNSLDRMLTLNRALDQAFNGVGGSRVWVPAIDVAERGDAYVILAELPGVSPEQVDVSFEQNILTIRGSKPASFDVAAEGEVRVFAAERVHGSFERSVRLPEFVDADNARGEVYCRAAPDHDPRRLDERRPEAAADPGLTTFGGRDRDERPAHSRRPFAFNARPTSCLQLSACLKS